MVVINFPEPGFRIKNENGREYIFDELRKKWLVLTPEEWVRQNFVQYLLQIKKYPAALIVLEKEIQLGQLKKRFDILVYNLSHEPWLMVECKAAKIKLDEKVLQQALRYNISMPVSFIVISNGKLTYAWEKKDGELKILSTIPSII